MNVLRLGLVVCSLAAAQAQSVEVVKVLSNKVERTLRLPGEFQPYQTVDLHARVAGFVEQVAVDRGSVVRRGDLLVTLSAPEMKARIAEAQSKVQALEAQRAETEAKVLAAQNTYDMLKAASQTPGVIAGNELIQAEKAWEAAKATRTAVEMSIKASESSVAALRELEGYLQVKAPFDGTVTERMAHPGALAGPGSGQMPLLKLEQISRLRLVVAVPESDVGGIVPNARVKFTVPAYPGETFTGTVARIGRSLDVQTRSMPVELDVQNPGARLSPGMYPEVQWPVHSRRTSLLVPPSSVATTTERSFVIRVNGGKAEWVTVRAGVKSGDLVEVFGNLKPGDEIVLRASDEIRNGSPVAAKLAAGK